MFAAKIPGPQNESLMKKTVTRHISVVLWQSSCHLYSREINNREFDNASNDGL